MEQRKEFDFFIDQLLDGAVQSFRLTDEYWLLKEKLDKMDGDCEVMLTEEARAFAAKCFELLTDVSGREEHFVYRRGMLDCVAILKCLGVLA